MGVSPIVQFSFINTIVDEYIKYIYKEQNKILSQKYNVETWTHTQYILYSIIYKLVHVHN